MPRMALLGVEVFFRAAAEATLVGHASFWGLRRGLALFVGYVFLIPLGANCLFTPRSLIFLRRCEE